MFCLPVRLLLFLNLCFFTKKEVNVRFYIHREGRGSIVWTSLLVVLVGLLAAWTGHWALYLLAVAAFFLLLVVLGFFRIPHRQYPQVDAASLLAPADGTVVDISQVQEPEYFSAPCTKISVFMSPANVHVNRYPVSGKVVYCRYHAGKYLVAWHEKSSDLNERNTVVVKTDEGKEILVRQIAGAVARRIVSYAHVGDEVARASELGFIKFGSRVDVFFPFSARIVAQVGQKVQGGISVLAEME